MTLLGIDVSVWQGGIAWDRVPRDIVFAIARATIKYKPDSWYASNARGITETGRLAGAYHYLYPGDGRGQADAFLGVVGSPKGKLCVVDVEAPDTKLADVDAFADRFFDQVPQHPLIVYTGKWFWAGRAFGNPNGSHIGPLWHSHYVSPDVALGNPPAEVYRSVPSSWWNTAYGGWAQATILQFTSSSSVPGISGRCDANAFRGTPEDLHKLAGLQEDNPLLTATDTSSTMIALGAGTQVYDLNGVPVVKMSKDYTVLSVGRSGTYDVVVITTGGVRQFMLVKSSTVMSRSAAVDARVQDLLDQRELLEADLAVSKSILDRIRAALS